ncbi:hypothetical protein DL95DRAFT_56104 [Leptodontidium sp. 2 PMI_412]|nr:hypothetical protein DL95DRAFT_56104 [Leptodontidium sp. 2 PMI_412]
MCRQTYAESHSLMFTTSTFHIPNPSTLHALTTSLQPSTLSLLRAINTMYPLPALPTVTDFYIVNLESRSYTPLHDIVDWMSMWDTLRSLDGLRTLKVVLRVVSGQREGWRRREEEILRCVCEARTGDGERGREFVLVFSWEKFVGKPGVVRTGGMGERGEAEKREEKEKEEEEVYKGWRVERGGS